MRRMLDVLDCPCAHPHAQCFSCECPVLARGRAVASETMTPAGIEEAIDQAIGRLCSCPPARTDHPAHCPAFDLDCARRAIEITDAVQELARLRTLEVRAIALRDAVDTFLDDDSDAIQAAERALFEVLPSPVSEEDPSR
jgi:hypothetical protein